MCFVSSDQQYLYSWTPWTKHFCSEKALGDFENLNYHDCVTAKRLLSPVLDREIASVPNFASAPAAPVVTVRDLVGRTSNHNC